MSLKKLNEEQVHKMSMIEVANQILIEQKEELDFLNLFHQAADAKQFSEGKKENYLARFYTDLNIDGRFTTIGSNKWGLKRWYPVDQTSEKLIAEVKKREKANEKSIKIIDDDDNINIDIDEEEEVAEEEIVYDEYELSADEDEN